ncbi:MAG: alkaline phosphatase family protein, partial [Microbacteriaceae bacterium]
MLPRPDEAAVSLADVLASGLAAVAGEAGRIPLPPVRKALVLLADGLGQAALRARAGHARRLTGRVGAGSAIRACFPATTSAAIASLATGVAPGQHGIVGFTVRDPATGAVVKQLSGLDDVGDIAAWQRVPTLFERAAVAGLDAVAIGPERYRDSGFSRAVLRGARYLPARTIDDRLGAALDWLAEPGRGIGYLYAPELDVAAHEHGWQSGQWTARLEELDAAVGALERMPRDVGVLLTADHGVLDVPAGAQILWRRDPALAAGVAA